MLHFAGFAMHQLGGAHDLSAEGSADGLVAEADSQDRNLARKMADKFNADSGFLRRARPRREHDALRAHSLDPFHGDLVISAHYNLSAQFAQILDQVVGE